MPTHLAGRPHYLSFLKPNYSWPVIHQMFFSLLWPGAFHISLRTHKTQPRRWKKRTNEQTRAWVSSKHMKREVHVTLLCSSPCICWLSWACILRETSTKPLGMLNHLLTALFYRPVYSAPFFVNWLSLSSLGSPLCGLRAKTDKRILWPTPTQTETNATHRVTIGILDASANYLY